MASAPPELETLRIEPESPARAAVIWLHGLGADYHDFASLVPELRLEPALALRFIFPNAPVRPVTINGGVRMRAWYDILDLDIGAEQDEASIRASAEAIARLAQAEIRGGIPASRIVLAGFSQGGAIALHAGLRFPERLGGLLVLSSYLPLAGTLEREASPAARATPIFMGHGRFDPIVPIELAQGSRAALSRAGWELEWHEYPMEHSLHPQEVLDLSRWLSRVLS